MGCDIHCVWQKRVGGMDGEWLDIESDFKETRHYQLFAVLAGVRNGWNVKPIAEPRGLPEGFGASTPHEDGHWTHGDSWMGDHSFSWLTGKEMMHWFETSTVVTRTGAISRRQYMTWVEGTVPDAADQYSHESWSLESAKTIDRSDLPEGWARDMLDDTWTRIRVSWPVDLREELSYFFDEVNRLIHEHGEIRLVFGFDN